LLIYRRLFNDDPPGLQLGLEYWRLRGTQASGRDAAIRELTALDRSYPGNTTLLQTLSQLLFAAGRDADALAALQRAGAVDQGRARVDFGGEGLVGNFQSFQNRAVKASKAEKVIRRGQLLQFAIRPLAKCATIMAGDLKGCRFENDKHLMTRAGHAVEINAGAGCHGGVHQ